MTSINTNTASTIAANALYKNERKMGVAMERLSTGLRINTAKDDAAGLAIAKKMSAQISGLRQASRNANDGIAMLQTFEGASGEITSMLNRMRDLKIQALNGTYTAADRANLGEEYDSLRNEITRTVSDTQWNTRNLMKGNAGVANTVSLMIGANAGQTMDVVINDWSKSVDQSLTLATHGGNGAVLGVLGNGIRDQVAGGTDQIDTIDLVNTTVKDGESFIIKSDGISYIYTNTSGADKTGEALATALVSAFSGVTDPVITNVDPGATGANTRLVITQQLDGPVSVSVTHRQSIGVDVSSWSSSDLRQLDRAIENATSERSKYGAYISRLEKTSDNLLNVALNTDASRGQIEDADYAAETTELARTQIIAQAGTAMLAQANQVKQTVLALLK